MEKSLRYERILRLNLFFYFILVFIVSSLFTFYLINDHYQNMHTSLKTLENNLINEEKRKTKQKVDQLIRYLYIYRATSLDGLSPEATKEQLRLFLKSFSLDINNYIFAFDFEGNQLVHHNTFYEGKNRIGLKDKNGFLIIKNLIDASKNEDGGFVEYTATLGPSDTNKYKLSYAKSIDDLQWVVGAGVYLERIDAIIEDEKLTLEKKFQKKLRTTILYAISFVIVALIISYLLFTYITKHFKFQRRIIQSKNTKLQELNHIIAEKVKKEEEENRKKDILLLQKSKLAFMGEVLNNIAHQWRQPLNQIISYASVSKFHKKHQQLSDEELMENLNHIIDSTQYLSQTIEDFRNFFLQSKTKEYKSIETIIEQSLKLFDSILHQYHIKIITDIQTPNVHILSEFLQVLLNFYNNAKDIFSERHCEQRIILIRSYKKETSLVLRICDSGGGIEEETMKRIFEPYYSTKENSLGIGLYMTSQIIDRHMQGNIVADNETFSLENQCYYGACFTITLKDFHE
ncbi:MAG: cache domain-containing protein [Sulfurospirillaceae bacterium]|nr:cache domain-containing protein [Sulfurospirillaceae bacterium]